MMATLEDYARGWGLPVEHWQRLIDNGDFEFGEDGVLHPTAKCMAECMEEIRHGRDVEVEASLERADNWSVSLDPPR